MRDFKACRGSAEPLILSRAKHSRATTSTFASSAVRARFVGGKGNADPALA